MSALLGLTLGFFVFVQLINHPTPIAAQGNPTPEVTVTRKVLPENEEDVLVTPIPTGIATQIEPVESPTATLEPLSTEAPPSTPAEEKAEESREGFDLSVILLATLIGLLILALVLILWRWQFRKAPRRASKRASSNASRAKKPKLVEWNLDLEPPILLPATLSEPSGGVPYLESLDRSTGTVYFALNQPVSRVGRGEENELRIDDSFMGWQTVSRHHARIERDGEEVILIDENSSHGTKVDGRHSNSNLLQNDCIISFGLVKFAFRNPNLKSKI
jgi:hypothetical protein